MGLRLITAPTVEVIAATDAADEARLSAAAELDRMGRYLVSARRYIEDLTGRALLDQTWELSLAVFPSIIELPRPPLIAIVSLKYVDPEGVTQTLASGTGYQLETYSGTTEAPMPSRLHAPYGATWPSTRSVPDAVLVRYRAGYGTAASSVPEALRIAVAKRAAQLYDGLVNDEDLLTLVGPYRLWSYR